MYKKMPEFIWNYTIAGDKSKLIEKNLNAYMAQRISYILDTIDEENRLAAYDMIMADLKDNQGKDFLKYL